MSPPAADPSVLSVLETIRACYPDVPFLALGQTVFWDEPVKAVWRRLLDQYLPTAHLIAGVHDTDYFAKTSAHVGDDQKYAALAHDDGRTRDLWSAAGEMSALFGSESIPTRAMFLKHGIPFDWLGARYPGGKGALYADKTAAWGWRGIVQTESHSVIAHDIPILDIKDALLEQWDWAAAESLACLADPQSQTRAVEIAAQVRGWILEFLEDCSDSCRLSDLYQALLPRFYRLLLHAPPTHFQATASTELFRFNRETFQKPRFSLIGVFLDPQTRSAAGAAYNKAVGGSGIYTLDAFGVGAIPFDLVIPGVGRGTIRVTARGIVIETAPQSVTLETKGPITRLDQLAALTEERFGPDTALVGKAVTLADMIAAEHLVVFHETASGYTTLTQAFNAGLAAKGVHLPLYPIVRLSYPTWDALADAPAETEFHLPPHLAATFGAETLPAREFAQRWREVVTGQTAALRQSRDLHSVRALLHSLSRKDDLAKFEAALLALREIAAHSATLRDRMDEHKQELLIWQEERAELERRKGDDWRTNVLPLLREASPLQAKIDRQMAIRATAFEMPLAECRERISATRSLLIQFRRQRRLLERGSEASRARQTLAEITRTAQMARLELVRSAYLTVESLEHTQYRPTAWWLPLVDPSGGWFDAIVAGTQARLEPLTGETSPPPSPL